eukprot:jgi/Hompol1/3177/HPOL_006385-RA
MAVLKDHPTLRLIDIHANELTSLAEVQMLGTLVQLRELNLALNPLACTPVETWLPKNIAAPIHAAAQYPPSYRLKVVFLLQQLTVLDGFPVTPEEKVAACNVYDPLPHVVVSVQHAHLQKRQAWVYARVKAEDLMRARRLRPVVLCGPNGAGKRTLTSRLLQEFPHIYGLTVSHTTRSPRSGEENGVHYHFVSRAEMEKMIDEGKFIQVVSLFGNMYGTSMEAVDKVTEEGKICIMDLEVEGVIALKKSHLKSRYIYVTTPNMAVLEERLHARLTPAEIIQSGQKLLSSAEQQQNSHAPSDPAPTDTNRAGEAHAASEVTGWLAKAKHAAAEYNSIVFDFTLVNDDLEQAYRQLKDYCLSMYWKDFEEED